jgi:hypothetical protein
MSTYALPVLSGVPWQEWDVELEQRTYRCELRWNDRAGGWFLSLSDSLGVRIVSSQKVVLDFPLTRRVADARVFPGLLMAHDSSGASSPPTLADLGTRVALLYFDSATTAELFPT